MNAFLPYELAIQRLQSPQIQLAPCLTLERVERDFASNGHVLDHFAGEEAIALGEDSDGQFTKFFISLRVQPYETLPDLQSDL